YLRNDHGDHRAAGIELFGNVAQRRRLMLQNEISARNKSIHEASSFRRWRIIQHDHRQGANLGGDDITVNHQLEQGRYRTHAQQPLVAFDLNEFFSDDVPDASHALIQPLSEPVDGECDHDEAKDHDVDRFEPEGFQPQPLQINVSENFDEISRW